MRINEIIRNPLRLPPSMPSQPYLYHGTQMPYLASIIAQDTLYQGAHWSKPNEPHGVRCTRSVQAAKGFAFDQEMPGGILVMDWHKISEQHKTIPHADSMYNDKDRSQPGEAWPNDEAEEVVLVKMIKPLKPFLVSVMMRSKELRQLKSGEFLKPEWIQSYIDWNGRSARTWRNAIEILMTCPLLKTIR